MIEPTLGESFAAVGIGLAVMIGPLLAWDGLKWLGRRIVRWAEDRVARDLEAGLRYPLDQPLEQPRRQEQEYVGDRPIHHWRPES